MEEWRTGDRGSRGVEDKRQREWRSGGQETERVAEWRTRGRGSGGVEDKRQRE